MSVETVLNEGLRSAFRKLHEELHCGQMTAAAFEPSVRQIMASNMDVGWAVEEEAQEEQEVKLELLPIYEAYRRAPLVDAGDALRLTFLELQSRIGYALTWPG